MNPFQKTLYLLLCLYTVSVVFWWRLGLISMALLTVVTLVGMLFLHAPKPIQKPRVAVMFILPWLFYVMVYLVSALYSTNHAEGWSTFFLKLPLFILPLLSIPLVQQLDCDPSAPDRFHKLIHSIFWLLVFALLLRFIICLAVCGIKLIGGATFAAVKDWQFDPLGMHHNYLALYVNVALAFLYSQTVNGRPLKLTLSCSLPLILYLFFGNSRSGIITFFLLVFLAILHTAFFRKRYKVALYSAVLVVALVGGTYLVAPRVFWRFTSIVTEMQAGRRGDERSMLFRCGVEAAQGHLLFGHGSGDYMEALLDQYAAHDFQKGIKENLGTHNQYLETLLETGIIGLVAMLVALLLPLYQALFRRPRSLLSAFVIIIILSQIIFESMLNRQMGVQFIALIYLLLTAEQLKTNTKQIEN